MSAGKIRNEFEESKVKFNEDISNKYKEIDNLKRDYEYKISTLISIDEKIKEISRKKATEH